MTSVANERKGIKYGAIILGRDTKELSSYRNRGFTLIELIVVIVIVGILAAIVVPRVSGYAQFARVTADNTAVRTLNQVTTLYSVVNQAGGGDIFEGLTTDEQRMSELVNGKVLSEIPRPQNKGVAFVWLIENQLWTIFSGEVMLPLSPLGSDFGEISSGMIKLIDQKFAEDGFYGRTWGDYVYTDIGLDPNDWKIPVAHIYFKPAGNKLRIMPEAGYEFVVEDLSGNTRVLSHALNWDLVYDAQNAKWYYHSISETNAIDIETLEIRRN